MSNGNGVGAVVVGLETLWMRKMAYADRSMISTTAVVLNRSLVLLPVITVLFAVLPDDVVGIPSSIEPPCFALLIQKFLL